MRTTHLENEVNDLQERLNYLERQLKIKTQEANRFKKQVNELEQKAKE